jgi:transposase-like protein
MVDQQKHHEDLLERLDAFRSLDERFADHQRARTVAIREALEGGVSVTRVARRLGVSPQRISQIKARL